MYFPMRDGLEVAHYASAPAPRQMVIAFADKYLRDFGEKVSFDTRRDLINEARKAGYYCYANLGSTFHELAHYLSLGIPVVVLLWRNDGVDQLAVVVSVRGNEIEIVYPVHLHHQKMPMDRFMKMWNGIEREPRRYLLVLSMSDFHLGRQYFPLTTK